MKNNLRSNQGWRYLSLIIASFAFAIQAFAYSFTADGIYYDINSTTMEATVTYKQYISGDRYESASYISGYQGDVVIPPFVIWHEETYTVTSIGDHAFDDSDVTSVSLPNTITSIGSSAFAYCTLLTNIKIPSSVTAIGSSAFAGTTAITEPIIINNQLVYFPPSYVGSYEIPKGVTKILDSAFIGCSGLTEIFIPNEVTEIGSYAFQGCSSLKSVIIPKGVYIINVSTFKDCTALEDVSLPNTIRFIDTRAFANSGIKTMIIPPLVTFIYNYAFYGCRSLQSLTFPASCSYCRLWAFDYTNNLTEIFDFADSQQEHPEGPVFGAASMGTVHVLPGKSSNFNSFPSSGWKPVEDLVSISSISMKQTTYSMTAGSQHQLQTTILPVNSSVQSLYWSSSNTDVLTVSSTGVVTAKANGTAVVTAETRDGSNLSASCTITVKTLIYGINESTISTFSNGETTDYEQITYTRNFKNTGWQELYVPFAMSYNDWKDDFEVGYIEGFLSRDTNNDGEIDETIWSGVKITEGTLLPNTPYIIRAKATGNKTITLNNATLYATEENSIDCSSTTMRYVFKGVYESESYASVDDYPYYLNNGVFNMVPRIVPFRWTLRFESRGTSFVIHPNLTRGMVRENDGTPFEEYVENNQDLFVGYKVYTLDGRMIDMTSEILKPGFYVKNGKKVLVK